MRTLLYSILIFFTSLINYGQDIERLKKSDTIYIEFRGKKNEEKHSIQTRIKPTNFDERAYNFAVPDQWSLYFHHIEYKNWEKKETNVVSEVRRINESFLKKHKDKIIGIDFLKKYNYEDIVCQILTQLKVLYIIDFTEKKKLGVKIYEVNLINYCPVSE